MKRRSLYRKPWSPKTLGGRVLLGLSFFFFATCVNKPSTPMPSTFAHGLAPADSAEFITALLKILETASPEEKAFVAQLAGRSGHPAAKIILWPWLEDADEHVVMATIQGLSAIGGDDVTDRIAGVISDNQRSDHIRVAAALGLGKIATPAGLRALVDTLSRAPSNELATQILSSLGGFEFPTVASTFEQYLGAAGTPSGLRVAAIEALSKSSAEAAPFLLRFAGNDGDADVRASAAWAISAQAMVKDLGPTLCDLAAREPIPEVRQRLYKALLPQDVIPAERLLPLVQAEKEVSARVAGFNTIGRAVYQAPNSAVRAQFDEQIVPELVQIATKPNSLNIQMRAVFALRRARTPAARAALTMIAYTARPQIATAARHGL